MFMITRIEVDEVLCKYASLSKKEPCCIICAGKSRDGTNLYRIIDKICCPLFSSPPRPSASAEHEEVLRNLIEDFEILYSSDFPTLLSSYPIGFINFLNHSDLRKRAIEIFKTKGADVSDF